MGTIVYYVSINFLYSYSYFDTPRSNGQYGNVSTQAREVIDPLYFDKKKKTKKPKL